MAATRNEIDKTMRQNNHGFTLIEIIVVLILISIISVTVLGRSIGTDHTNIVGQTDKIRNHIRYAQSLAMKRLDVSSDDRWGIKCSSNIYWLFKYVGFGTQDTPVRLPGEVNAEISLTDLGINMDGFTLYFDSLGVPYIQNSDNRVESTTLPISISAAADPTESRILIITPETGLIITQ